MVDLEALLDGFSANGLLKMYDSIGYALDEDKAGIGADLPSWQSWAAELERALDRKRVTYTKLEWNAT